jgi:chromate reductase
MMTDFKILGFAGSLRKGAYSRMVLNAAKLLAPDGIEVEIFDLEGIPVYNQDRENEPAARLTEFKERIAKADAVLIVTPEYNYSVPGVLKNALDAASRPYGTSPFAGKPVAIISNSPGQFGGSRAYYHLRQVFIFLDSHVLNRPEMMISNVDKKFDASGALVDEQLRQRLPEFLLALRVWAKKVKG